MSEMNSHESWERYEEGLLRAASCCRELGVLTKSNEWTEMSRQLLIMRDKGLTIYKAKPLNELQVQSLVADMEIAQKIAHAMGQTVH